MADPVPPPDNMPDLQRIILPTRAYFLSWREQTLPARLAAIEDAVDHFEHLPANVESGHRDMALLAVISDALQPLEDLAYLGTGWDRPFQGLATYVAATAWTRFTATNFWQESPKWNDERLDVFASFAGRNPEDQSVVQLLDGLESRGIAVSDSVRDSMDVARRATLDRLRCLLGGLGKDWKQLSPYYLAYKHGGLAINRLDTTFVTDDVDEVTEETPRHDPSVAVWTRAGRKQELQADFSLTRAALVRYAAGAGRLAVDLCDAFATTRLATIEALEFSPTGELVGMKPMVLPWTVWLRRQDLDDAHWARLGVGPRLTWIR